MRVFERLFFILSTALLLALSSSPATVRAAPRQDAPRVGTALNELHECFGDLGEHIRGRRVLDFGSGSGAQAVAFARHGASEVVGVEIDARGRESGARLAALHGVDDTVRFVERVGSGEHARFDVCVSLNSMEHFREPLTVLREIRDALRPGGRMLVSFSPPWYAPYGAHMSFFTRVPWVHLLFPERVVMAARSRFRDDGADRYEDVPGGLNRMSLARFERLIRQAGLRTHSIRYDTVRRLPLVGRIPLLRELLTNRVSAVLQRPLEVDRGAAPAPRHATRSAADAGPDTG